MTGFDVGQGRSVGEPATPRWTMVAVTAIRQSVASFLASFLRDVDLYIHQQVLDSSAPSGMPFSCSVSTNGSWSATGRLDRVRRRASASADDDIIPRRPPGGRHDVDWLD